MTRGAALPVKRGSVLGFREPGRRENQQTQVSHGVFQLIVRRAERKNAGETSAGVSTVMCDPGLEAKPGDELTAARRISSAVEGGHTAETGGVIGIPGIEASRDRD